MEGEKIFIADKLTLDEIHTLLVSSEIGLAALKDMLSANAGVSEETASGIDTLITGLGSVEQCLADSAAGLGAIKAAVDGKADAETVAAAKALLENGTYGLNAIKSAVNGRANETTAAAIKALLENGTYGLYAILSAISGKANETTAAAIKSLLENGAYGLNALKTAITGNLHTIKSVQSGLLESVNGATVYNVTISPVVISKTFVIAQPAQFLLNGGEIYKGATVPVAIRLVNSTTIQIAPQSNGAKALWQVVEFY